MHAHLELLYEPGFESFRQYSNFRTHEWVVVLFVKRYGFDIFFYYIHTEKYSPKSYVVSFRTQISSSQSEERTMVFTGEKNDTSNHNRERCFFTCEKNDTSKKNDASGGYFNYE